MPRNTRYDKLKHRIRKDFERVKTFEVSSIPTDSRELVINGKNDTWRGNHEDFAAYRPYNALSVENNSDQPVRVMLNSKRDLFFDVPANSARSMDSNAYYQFLTVHNQGSATIADGAVQISAGTVVDDRELRLLEMSGMLNFDQGAF